MVSLRRVALLVGVTAVTAAVVRHARHGTTAEHVEGGILMGNSSAYDARSRYLFGSYYTGVADNVAVLAPVDAKVLDVGCGPGQLSIRLAQRGLHVTGLDLDERMIERARANAERALWDRPDGADDAPMPDFMVGSAAALPFPDESFDIVVSTMSVHHWDDPVDGLAEIARVLRPTGRALIWDLRPGVLPFHRDSPDALDSVHGGPLRLVAAAPWRWPWRLELSQRIELVPATWTHA